LAVLGGLAFAVCSRTVSLGPAPSIRVYRAASDQPANQLDIQRWFILCEACGTPAELAAAGFEADDLTVAIETGESLNEATIRVASLTSQIESILADHNALAMQALRYGGTPAGRDQLRELTTSLQMFEADRLQVLAMLRHDALQRFTQRDQVKAERLATILGNGHRSLPPSLRVLSMEAPEWELLAMAHECRQRGVAATDPNAQSLLESASNTPAVIAAAQRQATHEPLIEQRVLLLLDRAPE